MSPPRSEGCSPPSGRPPSGRGGPPLITGRGAALTRGMITGIATFVGGTAHALPFLINDVHTALTVAYVVVSTELVVISWVRKRFLGVALRTSLIQVTL